MIFKLILNEIVGLSYIFVSHYSFILVSILNTSSAK